MFSRVVLIFEGEKYWNNTFAYCSYGWNKKLDQNISLFEEFFFKGSSVRLKFWVCQVRQLYDPS